MKTRIAHTLLLAGLGAYTQSSAILGETVASVDATRRANIRFVHSFGNQGMSSILGATGSGCLFFDYDNDGFMDLYAVNGSYLEGINEEPEDENTVENLQNQLFRNQGDGTFADLTAPTGTGDSRWSVGAAFLDYDNDGDLDLYVGNYLEFDPEYRLYYAADQFPGPLAYPGQPDVLYRNEDDGTFTDATAAAGVLSEARAMGLVAGDYNSDGLVDLYVANDAMQNFLYHNNGDGTFTDVGLVSGTAFSANGDASSSMGGDFGDFDLDGDLDLFMPDMAYNNLYVNIDNQYFEDYTTELGIAELSGQYVSWHGDFFDYDNDADLDLIITNGDAHRLEHTQEALLMANVPRPEGGRTFVDVSAQSGSFFYHRCVSRGAAAGDYDNDGDLDLFVLHLDQPSMLLRNEGGNANHWLLIDLQGTASNRDGIGARVQVRTGDLVQVAEALSGSGYISQNDPRLHFGLGPHTRVDTIAVRWPSGRVQHLIDVAADQVLAVVEPSE